MPVDRMSPVDAAFLYAEDGTSHFHIGSCAVFAGPAPTLADVVAMVAARLDQLPRYRQGAQLVPGGLGHPVWVDDPAFDLRAHVRRTALDRGRDQPAGHVSDQEALERLVGRLMAEELDRRRPLWEMWLVTGLADDRWALVSKVHHCMVDGIAGTGLMTALLDEQPRPLGRQRTTAGEWQPAPAPTATALALDAVAQMALRPARAASALAGELRHPARVWRAMACSAAGLASLAERIARPAPHRATEGLIGRQRTWVVARTELADLKAIRAALGGSVNDVVLAAVTAAFRCYLLDRGDAIASGDVMRALVPVSRRRPGDRTTNNQVALMIAELPIGCADPRERARSITAQMGALKRSHQSEAAGAAFDALTVLPAPIVATTIKTTMRAMHLLPQHLLHTVVTNVPGPQLPLYAMGRQMLEYWPFVPVSEGLRIGVAVMSYDGHVAFGLTGDRDSVTDLNGMAAAIEAELATLSELAEQAARPAMASVRTLAG